MGELRYPGIDIVKMISIWDTKDWNAMLTKCVRENDLNKLIRTRYGMQAGYAKAVKDGLVTSREQIIRFAHEDGVIGEASGDRILCVWLRMMKSLELTARKIIHRMVPLPDPKISPEEFTFAQKRRTALMKEWMQKSSY